jgi:Zn-dependent protease with chaperone function
VALRGINVLPFQEAEAVPCIFLLDIPLSSTRRAVLEGWPTCENDFTAPTSVTSLGNTAKVVYSSRNILGGSNLGGSKMKSLSSPPSSASSASSAFCRGVWSAILTVGLVFCIQSLWASDRQPHVSGPAGEASNSASPITPTVPNIEEKIVKSDEYDVNRIGQRKVGQGLNLYSLEKERALGEAIAAAIDRHTTFVADQDISEYVRQLAQKIARNSDAQVPLTVKVIDSPDLRIFGLPGGFLYVDKGVILEVDSEAELAGLMAHEIAHIAARHATRLATRKHAWDMLSIPLSYISGPAAIGTNQIGPLSLKKFNRDSEVEADLLGIEYQYAAGYDPQAFVQALERLHSKEIQTKERIAKAAPMVVKIPFHAQIAREFSNYPPTEERIQKVQAVISTFLPRRDDYVCDTSEFQEVRARLSAVDRPVLRRHRAGEQANGAVLYRRGSQASEKEDLAGDYARVTKGRLYSGQSFSVFSHLPVFPY